MRRKYYAYIYNYLVFVINYTVCFGDLKRHPVCAFNFITPRCWFLYIIVRVNYNSI